MEVAAPRIAQIDEEMSEIRFNMQWCVLEKNSEKNGENFDLDLWKMDSVTFSRCLSFYMIALIMINKPLIQIAMLSKCAIFSKWPKMPFLYNSPNCSPILVPTSPKCPMQCVETIPTSIGCLFLNFTMW